MLVCQQSEAGYCNNQLFLYPAWQGCKRHKEYFKKSLENAESSALRHGECQELQKIVILK